MSYFDLKIDRIPVAQGKPLAAGDDREAWLPVSVASHGFDWWMDRWKQFVGESLEGSLCYLRIEDNGIHGDGLWMIVCAGEDRYEVVRFEIPDESLDAVIAALQAVKAMREATE